MKCMVNFIFFFSNGLIIGRDNNLNFFRLHPEEVPERTEGLENILFPVDGSWDKAAFLLTGNPISKEEADKCFKRFTILKEAHVLYDYAIGDMYVLIKYQD